MPVYFNIRVFLKDIYVSEQTGNTVVTLNFTSPEFFVLRPSATALTFSHIKLDIKSKTDECMSVVVQRPHCPLETPQDVEGVVAYFTMGIASGTPEDPTRVLLKVKFSKTSMFHFK